jgi:putative ABC transport system permease protein
LRLSTLAYLYARRLRTHPIQEVLAGIGITVGVALVFAVQVATSSVADSSSQIVHGILGPADLQVSGGGEAGLDEALAVRVSSLPGVRRVVRGIEATVTASGPSGRRVTLQLATADLAPGSGAGVADDPLAHLAPGEVVLPRASADALGVRLSPPGAPVVKPRIAIQAHGRVYPMRVAAVIGPESGGALASALATFASVRTVQRLLNLRGRVTGILVQSQTGAHDRVKRELQHVAPAGATVADADAVIRLLRQATGPNRQASGFFALVAALVGLLLAFNAMLLSVPERRRVVADLRIQGARPYDVVRLLLFQALCLGVVSSLLGVALGDVLSRAMFKETPGYLAAAFPLGTQTVIGWQPAVLAIVGGIGAACLASLTPLFDLRRARALDAVRFTAGEPGQGLSLRARLWLFGVAMGLMLASLVIPAIFGAREQAAAIVALALATLLSVPLMFTAFVAVVQALASRTERLNLLLLATRTLRATTIRSLALAASGAIAVFGTIAAEGAHGDLLRGLYSDYSQYAASADVWVTNPGDYLATRTFAGTAVAAELGHLPGVRAARPYYGGFLDIAGHRAWLIARSPQAPGSFPSGQIAAGERRLMSARLRSGGWVTLSAQLASALHASPGGLVTLPTPAGPMSFRLAATTSNLGWSAGAIVLNSSDFLRGWPGADPTAVEVDLPASTDRGSVEREIRARLGRGSDLAVQSAGERAARADPLAREGLARLSQISMLLAIAAALATAAAMAASIWQRRAALASLRLQSFSSGQLRAILLSEATMVITLGCLWGAVTGVWAHAQIDRYLRLVSGFPAPFAPAVLQGLEQIGVILGATLIAVAVPGLLASAAPPRLALGERG